MHVPETVRTAYTTTTTTHSPDPEDVRWDYITRADNACRVAIENRPAAVPVLTYDYMMNVLVAQNGMLADWRSVLIEPYNLVNVSRGLRRFGVRLQSASWYWKYMADALLVKNRAAFSAELERYRAATFSFIYGADRYGFKVCNYGWNIVLG